MPKKEKTENSLSIPAGKEVSLQTKYLKITKELTAKVEKYEALDPESVNDGVAIVKEIQYHEKEIDTIRDGLVRPHNTYVKSVNDLAKGLITPLTQLKKLVNIKVTEYNNKVLAKAQEEAKKLAALEEKRLADIEADRLEREANEKALRAEEEKAGNVDEEARAKREAEEDKLRINEEIRLSKQLGKKSDKIDILNQQAKVKGLQKRWTYRIVNPDLVDRAFCSPDSVKINAAIKTGLREAQGLEIFEEAKII